MSLKKGETTYFEHAYDATDNTGVFGTVSKDGQPFKGCSVRLYSFSVEKTISEVDTDINGKHILKNVPKGTYVTIFSYIDDQEKYHSKDVYLEIKKSEMKQIDIDIDF